MNKYTIIGMCIFLLGLFIVFFPKSPLNNIGVIISDVKKSNINSSVREKENPSPPSKSKKKIGKWEDVGIFPIPIDKKTLNLVSGRNGERARTGEMWIPYVLLSGWEYKITFSGGYQKLFWHLPWINIPYRGDDGVAGQGVKKPFNIPYGALVLRVGKVSIFPAENTDSVFCQAKNSTKIFAELNINREPAEYYTPKLGFKLRNKNLSIKIERRRILKE